MTKPFQMESLSPHSRSHSHEAGVSKPASAMKWLRRCEGGVKKKKKQISSSSLQCEISWDDLLPDIIKTLPFKSLCRFKCVSKFWRSMIINQSPQQLARQPIIIMQYGISDDSEYDGTARLYSVDGETGLATHICTSPHLGVYLYSDFVNGLFCYYDAMENKFGVCNPFTREKILLPDNQVSFGNGLNFGFGFHLVSNQYKLVYCGTYPDCEIFTLGTTSWRKLRSTLPLDCGKPFRESVCIHGTMYWYSDTDMVISFELATESFGAIQGPKRLTHGPEIKSTVVYLFDFEGCLCLTNCHSIVGNIMDLWMLKDGGNWVVITSVASPSSGLRWAQPYSTGNGELVLAYNYGSQNVLYLYSLLKQQFDVIKVVGVLPDSNFVIVNYESNSLSLRDL